MSMGRTKVVGIAGRFGPRYGSSVRKKWRDIVLRKYQLYYCPFCGLRAKMRRISVGVWSCSKCGKVFTGGAYQPVSSSK